MLFIILNQLIQINSKFSFNQFSFTQYKRASIYCSCHEQLQFITQDKFLGAFIRKVKHFLKRLSKQELNKLFCFLSDLPYRRLNYLKIVHLFLKMAFILSIVLILICQQTKCLSFYPKYFSRIQLIKIKQEIS